MQKTGTVAISYCLSLFYLFEKDTITIMPIFGKEYTEKPNKERFNIVGVLKDWKKSIHEITENSKKKFEGDEENWKKMNKTQTEKTKNYF